jgi:hypothetical protein
MFLGLLFGHIVGDYWLQRQWEAVEKGAKGWRGLFVCFLHCVCYSSVVLAFLAATGYKPHEWLRFGWLTIGTVVFWTHFPIDRWSLAKHVCGWLGRTIDETSVVNTVFACIVYTVIDNSAHLMLMYFALKQLGG